MTTALDTWHVTRGGAPGDHEHGCPCPKEPCGAVDVNHANPACDQHPLDRARTMRHMHRASDCPGPRTATEPAPTVDLLAVSPYRRALAAICDYHTGDTCQLCDDQAAIANLRRLGDPWRDLARMRADWPAWIAALRTDLQKLVDQRDTARRPDRIVEQWAIRKTSAIDGDGVSIPLGTRAEAEAALERRLSASSRTWTTAELVHRELRYYPNRSVLVTDWVPAAEQVPA